MLNNSRAVFLKWLLFIFDFAILLFSFLLAYSVRNVYFYEDFDYMANIGGYLWVPLFAVPLWLFLFYVFGLYKLKQKTGLLILKCALSILIGAILIASVFYFTHDNGLSRLFFALFSFLSGFFVIGIRVIAKTVMLILQYNNKTYKKIIVAGTNSLAEKFTDYVNDNPELMLDIVGYIQMGEAVHNPGFNTIGKLDDLAEILKNNVVDEVIFALPRDFTDDIEPYILQCEAMGITAYMIANLFNLSVAKARIGTLGTLPVIAFHSVSLDYGQLLLKRVIDIAGACVGLLITAVAFIFVAPLIYIESHGPIFFSQDRVGKNGRIFRCYKFRSMIPDAEAKKEDLQKFNLMNGNMFKVANDPRITKVGKFLRASSIDEFPQFWNVLRGDMSLVGTRPPTVDEVQTYKDYHWRRLSIKPGLTGMWQVKGRNKINDFEEIVKLDTTYIDNWSLWLDLAIIFKTFKAVIAKNGAL